MPVIGDLLAVYQLSAFPVSRVGDAFIGGASAVATAWAGPGCGDGGGATAPGRSGGHPAQKTTLLRWIGETSIRRDSAPIRADIDHPNASYLGISTTWPGRRRTTPPVSHAQFVDRGLGVVPRCDKTQPILNAAWTTRERSRCGIQSFTSKNVIRGQGRLVVQPLIASAVLAYH